MNLPQMPRARAKRLTSGIGLSCMACLQPKISAQIVKMGELLICEDCACAAHVLMNRDADASTYYCCPHEKIDPHPCPFNQEIKGDDDTLCRCCEACIIECSGDI